VFLAGQTIGINYCFVNTCLGTVAIPQGTPSGNYQVFVEGGFCLTVTVVEVPQVSGEPDPLVLAAIDFSDGGSIPARYSCDGEDICPALAWSAVPHSTETLELIMDDPEARRWISVAGWGKLLRKCRVLRTLCALRSSPHLPVFLYAVDVTLELEARGL